ncbi:lytic transglycosylase domain-containing protein [Enterovibrio calviensis]|uniref:lytic transglycosylase domain-containing protein n=1 Tax=Enterovibrio calviensis TaxID=91359 RepID=UPI003734D07B
MIRSTLTYAKARITLIFACSLVVSLSLSAAPTQSQIEQEFRVLAPYKTQILSQFDSYSPLVKHILGELRSQGLPSAFVLIPMLESSYNPSAVSSASASGLWQLMPATAKRFGLTVESDKDERFDAYASTDAAIKYLKFLHHKFDGDLALTLAAYNAGEGRVSRAIKRAGTNVFSSLKLPKETTQYVSRFYGLNELVNVKALDNEHFEPMLLFAGEARLAKRPLIDFAALPPLVSL